MLRMASFCSKGSKETTRCVFIQPVWRRAGIHTLEVMRVLFHEWRNPFDGLSSGHTSTDTVKAHCATPVPHIIYPAGFRSGAGMFPARFYTAGCTPSVPPYWYLHGLTCTPAHRGIATYAGQYIQIKATCVPVPR